MTSGLKTQQAVGMCWSDGQDRPWTYNGQRAIEYRSSAPVELANRLELSSTPRMQA
jgi:hypothetical protein